MQRLHSHAQPIHAETLPVFQSLRGDVFWIRFQRELARRAHGKQIMDCADQPGEMLVACARWSPAAEVDRIERRGVGGVEWKPEAQLCNQSVDVRVLEGLIGGDGEGAVGTSHSAERKVDVQCEGTCTDGIDHDMSVHRFDSRNVSSRTFILNS